MGHGSLDKAGPCSPPRWHPVWKAVWWSWLALKQTITPLKVPTIKATVRIPLGANFRRSIKHQLPGNPSAERDTGEQALPSSLWKCQTRLIEGCMGRSPQEAACASSVSSICVSKGSGPWRIQHTSCEAKISTSNSLNQPQITTTVDGVRTFSQLWHVFSRPQYITREHRGWRKCPPSALKLWQEVWCRRTWEGRRLCVLRARHLFPSWGCCDYLVKIAILSTQTKLTMANDPLTGIDSWRKCQRCSLHPH